MKETYTHYKWKLSGDYKEAFDRITVYAQSHIVSFDTLNEMMMELLDVFLEAQAEGRAVEKLIGSNIERFCKYYFENYTFKQRMANYAKEIRYWFAIVFFVNIIFYIPINFKELFALRIDGEYFISILMTLIVFVCGGAINVLFKKIMFKWRKIKPDIYFVIRFGIYIMVLVVLMWIAPDEFNLPPLPIWPMFVLTGGYVFFYQLIVLIGRIRRGEPVIKWFGNRSKLESRR